MWRLRLDRIFIHNVSGVGNVRNSIARAARLLDDLGDLADAERVLRRDRQRLAEAERIGLVDARLGRAALAFIGGEDHRLAGAAHQLGENLVCRHHAGPRVDQEQHQIGLGDRRLRLLAHARGKPLIPGLEPRGIDEGDGARPKLGLGLAPVARQTGLVVDQRQLLADQPVEQGGLADIRPSDDGDGEGHWPPVNLRAGYPNASLPLAGASIESNQFGVVGQDIHAPAGHNR